MESNGLISWFLSWQALVTIGSLILVFSISGFLYYSFFRKKNNKKLIAGKNTNYSNNNSLIDSVVDLPSVVKKNNYKDEENKSIYYLIPLSNSIGLQRFSLPASGSYYLGRRSASNIQLIVDNQYVSREHALITVNPDKSCFIEDLGSRNKTYIDGKEILKGEITLLKLDQKLSFGHSDITYILKKPEVF